MLNVAVRYYTSMDNIDTVCACMHSCIRVYMHVYVCIYLYIYNHPPTYMETHAQATVQQYVILCAVRY